MCQIHVLKTAWISAVYFHPAYVYLWLFRYLLVLVLLDDLIYGNPQSNIVVAGMTVVLIDPELCSSHCLSIWDLSQIKTELLVVSSLVRKIFIFLDWGREYFMMNFIFTGSKLDQSMTSSHMCCSNKKLVALTHRKSNLLHRLLHSWPNPNILTTNKSTFHFIKSVNWIQVAVPRQALYCVPNCILWPWWMGCQLRKTGWFQLKTLSSAPQVREKTRQDSSTSCERLLWPPVGFIQSAKNVY